MRFSDSPLSPGSRVAARIEYHGGHYHGWQAQPQLSVPTVQEALEAALGEVAGEPIRTTCAGRTDTGVHGFAQVVHFDDPAGRSLKAWVMGTNRHLPDDIRVHWAKDVGETFHARFSATSRRYRYIICNSPVRPALLTRTVSWWRHSLDLDLMNQAAARLIGERDFSAFRAASCQAASPNRCVTSCEVTRRGDYVIVDISANAFLHHMVRNIVGSLLSVGSQSHSVEWFEKVLEGGDRTQAAETAPADGLYLVSVTYPDEFCLPATPEGPTLLEARL